MLPSPRAVAQPKIGTPDIQESTSSSINDDPVSGGAAGSSAGGWSAPVVAVTTGTGLAKAEGAAVKLKTSGFGGFSLKKGKKLLATKSRVLSSTFGPGEDETVSVTPVGTEKPSDSRSSSAPPKRLFAGGFKIKNKRPKFATTFESGFSK